MTKRVLVHSILWMVFFPLSFGVLLISGNLYAYLLQIRFGIEATLLPVVVSIVAVSLYTWYLARVTKAIVRQYKEKVSDQ